MFGRATITLGIGTHSSSFFECWCLDVDVHITINKQLLVFVYLTFLGVVPKREHLQITEKTFYRLDAISVTQPTD